MVKQTQQLRMTDTPWGTVYYTFTRKRVKNWNLRVREGQVLLSAPARTSDAQADGFIRSRGEWIFSALARQDRKTPLPAPVPPLEECRALLEGAVERMLPYASRLGIARPAVKLRRMKSQWGNCHYRQGYITLNTALAACPEELQDYVALHELVHFRHPDHGPGFRAAMTALMPDWQERRRALKGCAI